MGHARPPMHNGRRYVYGESMTQDTKPQVIRQRKYSGELYWYWYCPWSHCPSVTCESYGHNRIWELALRDANEHAEKYHNHTRVPHDL